MFAIEPNLLCSITQNDLRHPAFMNHYETEMLNVFLDNFLIIPTLMDCRKQRIKVKGVKGRDEITGISFDERSTEERC